MYNTKSGQQYVTCFAFKQQVLNTRQIIVIKIEQYSDHKITF